MLLKILASHGSLSDFTEHRLLKPYLTLGGVMLTELMLSAGRLIHLIYSRLNTQVRTLRNSGDKIATTATFPSLIKNNFE